MDGWNSFNPYALSRMAKSAGVAPKKILSRVHVARAFTEYQMTSLVEVKAPQLVEVKAPQYS